MAPLVVWPVTTLLAIAAVLALAVGIDAATRVVEVSIARYDAVHRQPSHPVTIFGERVVVPASETFASCTLERRSAIHTGWTATHELPGDYRHASVGDDPSTLRLSEPRPRGGTQLAVPIKPEWDFYVHDCDATCVEALVPPLDAWLADPSARRFHATVPAAVPGVAAGAFGAFALAVALLVLQLSCRVEVGMVSGSVVVTRRLGPVRGIAARVLLSEVAGVRVLARTWGPFTFHRVVLGLVHGPLISVWPWGGRLSRALTARAALVSLLERERDARRTAPDASPFRGSAA